MNYLTVAEARERDGIKLALTRGVPGPWGESAKAILRYHQLPFLPVAQQGAQPNEDLLDWTGHRNAPLLIVPGEPVRAHWLEILNYAERNGRGQPLLPEAPALRVEAVGLAHEICGENGLAWQLRLLMLDLMQTHSNGGANPMLDAYGYPAGFAAERATIFNRIDRSLALFNDQLERQQRQDSDYLIGDGFTIVDLYWAYFSQMLKPLPAPDNPVSGFSRSLYELYDRLVPQAPLEALIAHQRRIFDRHLELPLSF
jgi:glutathione S-transferase